MKNLYQTMRAAAIALVLCSPVHGQDATNDQGSEVDSPQPDGAAPRDMDHPIGDTNHEAADRATSSEAKPADNTAHNAHDVAGDDLTPFDQSDAEADIEITRSIRKKLMDDDTLGTNAQNVKVITRDGKVTLRGAVANATDQARIVGIAKEAAGPDRVANELQVIKN